MAMMASWMCGAVHVRFGEKRQGNPTTTPCFLLYFLGLPHMQSLSYKHDHSKDRAELIGVAWLFNDVKLSVEPERLKRTRRRQTIE